MNHRPEMEKREKPLILIVEDIPRNVRELAAILDPEFMVAEASDGNQALLMTHHLMPDLVLLDIMIPRIDGIEVCKKLKKNPDTMEIPVVLLTVHTEKADIMEGFRAGAGDYIPKPVDPEELLTRVRTQIQMHRNKRMIAEYVIRLQKESLERKALEKRVDELTLELEEKSKQLDKMDSVDSLTDLYNYKFIIKRLSQSIAEARRYGHNLSIILFDIDQFKKINTNFGFKKGDEVLAGVAVIIKRSLREADIAGRYSGDEFLVILPHTDMEGGKKTAERIRESVENHAWDEIDHSVTLSGGVGSLGGYGTGDAKLKTENILYQMIMKADNLLYRAKEGGKNRIESDSD